MPVDIAVILLVLVYVAPLASVALWLSGSQVRHAKTLAVGMAALPLLYGAHYLLLQEIQGWPSDSATPDNFELLAFSINEPRSTQDDLGSILLWARTDADADPRAYRLAYDRALHEALNAVAQDIAAGEAKYAETFQASGTASGAPNPRGIRFTDAPPGNLPAKDAQSD